MRLIGVVGETFFVSDGTRIKGATKKGPADELQPFFATVVCFYNGAGSSLLAHTTVDRGVPNLSKTRDTISKARPVWLFRVWVSRARFAHRHSSSCAY